MKEILKLDHIQKYYGNGGNVTKAIQDISFSVQEGEFVGIMGASGSGKTTLLNCISTIDTVSAGHIYLGRTERSMPERPARATIRPFRCGIPIGRHIRFTLSCTPGGCGKWPES